METQIISATSSKLRSNKAAFHKHKNGMLVFANRNISLHSM